ncbi:MAG: hypothetical protein HY812_12755 [Planctomycetes bacterium]|nr:hypothetical protein [Planctomycetota bacterium]
MSAPTLAEILERRRHDLLELLKREGSGLLGHESPDDLLQGVWVRALERAGFFQYRGERQAFFWLAEVARQHIADRHRYWKALRRAAGKTLHLTATGGRTAASGRGAGLASSQTSPSTAASRNESVALAVKALGILFPRDRDIIVWMTEDAPLEEMARRLGVGHDAAKKARERAVSRFRKAFELLCRRS